MPGYRGYLELIRLLLAEEIGMNHSPSTLLIFYEYPTKGKAMMNDEVSKRYFATEAQRL